MDWAYEPLWLKTRVCVARAREHDPSDSLFAFWSVIALELLARAALAHTHPALLANPTGDDIFYAFGHQQTRIARSIPAKTVFDRCARIVPDFSVAEVTSCMAFVEQRNLELHTGALPFEGLTTTWLAEYYRVCDLLLRGQGKKLGRLFGGEEARAARRMIRAATASNRKRVLDTVSEHRRIFESLSGDERAERRARESPSLVDLPPFSRIVPCPSCESAGILAGSRVSSREPRLDGDFIVEETVVLPTRFACPVCNLSLPNHVALHHAGLGGQYTTQRMDDALEYYGTAYQEILARDWGDDYGND